MKPSKIFYFAVIISLVFLSNSYASWPFTTGSLIFSSPSVADLDGDKKLEILFGSWDGYLYCLDPMGNLKWKYLLNGAIHASPTIIDLDNNPATKEVVIGGGIGWTSGIVVVLKYDGTLLASFSNNVAFTYSSPLVTDLDNDGEMEILTGEQEADPLFIIKTKLFCIRVVKSGSNLQLIEKWKFSGGKYVWASSPAAVDVDNDGLKEVIACNGVVFCLESDGSVKWSLDPGYGVGFSSPIPIDLNGNNQMDILISTGPVTTHGVLYYLNGLTGAQIWSIPFFRSIMNGPAVANILGDYHPEIVLAVHDPSYVYCIDYTGNEIWSDTISEWIGFSSPAIGDLTGNGTYEILIGTQGDYYIDAPPMIRAYNADGTRLWSIPQPGTVYSSPSLADLDDDGNLEVLFGCYDHKFYVLNHLGSLYNPAGIVAVQDTCPWPMYRHDANRTGQYIRLNILSVNDPVSGLPKDYSLFQNYPNPFNPFTKIKFDIPKDEFVSLKVYDLLGREVAALINGVIKAGTYEATFFAGDLPSGIYFYKLTAGKFTDNKKMILIK